MHYQMKVKVTEEHILRCTDPVRVAVWDAVREQVDLGYIHYPDTGCSEKTLYFNHDAFDLRCGVQLPDDAATRFHVYATWAEKYTEGMDCGEQPEPFEFEAHVKEW